MNDCTNFKKTNCERQADGYTIINPVRSACLTTEKSFSFKYGRVEIIAKLPLGDWLWPGKNLDQLNKLLLLNLNLYGIGQVHGQCEFVFFFDVFYQK